MIDYLELPLQKCEVMEGIASEENILEFESSETNGKKAFMYAGTLNYIYGIKDLVEGFREIKNKDIELWICGTGEAEKEILQNSFSDKRIKYYGNLKESDLKLKYKKCYALINPRSGSGKYVKYSFPSKIIEYLSTGKPTIAHYLAGMPEEYKKYIFEIKGEGKDGIKNSLSEFLKIDYQYSLAIAKNAKRFVLENKIERIQAKRILNLMNKERLSR